MKLPWILVSVLILNARCLVAQPIAGSHAAADAGFGRFEPHPGLLCEYEHLSAASSIHFLVSQISTNVEASDSEANWRKATAMRLLARSSASNRLDVLLDNITFVDSKHHTYPAFYGLSEMGEDIVSRLLEFAITNRDYQAVDCAGEVMRSILGQERFRQLLEENRQRMPALVYQVLSATTVD